MTAVVAAHSAQYLASNPVGTQDGSQGDSRGGLPRLLAVSDRCPKPMLQRDQWSLSELVLVRQVGSGAASSVYYALCRRSHMPLAVKIYDKSKLSTLNRHQVEREVQIHSSVSHPHIIEFYAAFEDDYRVYLLMEFADRGDLFDEVKRRGGRLSEQEVVVGVLTPYLDALSYLHTRGIIHRDIKPENTVFSKQGMLKVADFGLAICAEQERPVTRLGTLDYMAPEVLRCPDKHLPDDNKERADLSYGPGVDAWALGILAYELLVGRPPFGMSSRDETIRAICAATPPIPDWLSRNAASFIIAALQPTEIMRPSVLQLRQHPWITAAHGNSASLSVLPPAATASASYGCALLPATALPKTVAPATEPPLVTRAANSMDGCAPLATQTEPVDCGRVRTAAALTFPARVAVQPSQVLKLHHPASQQVFPSLVFTGLPQHQHQQQQHDTAYSISSSLPMSMSSSASIQASSSALSSATGATLAGCDSPLTGYASGGGGSSCTHSQSLLLLPQQQPIAQQAHALTLHDASVACDGEDAMDVVVEHGAKVTAAWSRYDGNDPAGVAPRQVAQLLFDRAGGRHVSPRAVACQPAAAMAPSSPDGTAHQMNTVHSSELLPAVVGLMSVPTSSGAIDPSRSVARTFDPLPLTTSLSATCSGGLGSTNSGVAYIGVAALATTSAASQDRRRAAATYWRTDGVGWGSVTSAATAQRALAGHVARPVSPGAFATTATVAGPSAVNAATAASQSSQKTELYPTTYIMQPLYSHANAAKIIDGHGAALITSQAMDLDRPCGATVAAVSCDHDKPATEAAGVNRMLSADSSLAAQCDILHLCRSESPVPNAGRRQGNSAANNLCRLPAVRAPPSMDPTAMAMPAQTHAWRETTGLPVFATSTTIATRSGFAMPASPLGTALLSPRHATVHLPARPSPLGLCSSPANTRHPFNRASIDYTGSGPNAMNSQGSVSVSGGAPSSQLRAHMIDAESEDDERAWQTDGFAPSVSRPGPAAVAQSRTTTTVSGLPTSQGSLTYAPSSARSYSSSKRRTPDVSLEDVMSTLSNYAKRADSSASSHLLVQLPLDMTTDAPAATSAVPPPRCSGGSSVETSEVHGGGGGGGGGGACAAPPCAPPPTRQPALGRSSVPITHRASGAPLSGGGGGAGANVSGVPTRLRRQPNFSTAATLAASNGIAGATGATLSAVQCQSVPTSPSAQRRNLRGMTSDYDLTNCRNLDSSSASGSISSLISRQSLDQMRTLLRQDGVPVAADASQPAGLRGQEERSLRLRTSASVTQNSNVWTENGGAAGGSASVGNGDMPALKRHERAYGAAATNAATGAYSGQSQSCGALPSATVPVGEASLQPAVVFTMGSTRSLTAGDLPPPRRVHDRVMTATHRHGTTAASAAAAAAASVALSVSQLRPQMSAPVSHTFGCHAFKAPAPLIAGGSASTTPTAGDHHPDTSLEVLSPAFQSWHTAQGCGFPPNSERAAVCRNALATQSSPSHSSPAASQFVGFPGMTPPQQPAVAGVSPMQGNLLDMVSKPVCQMAFMMPAPAGCASSSTLRTSTSTSNCAEKYVPTLTLPLQLPLPSISGLTIETPQSPSFLSAAATSAARAAQMTVVL